MKKMLTIQVFSLVMFVSSAFVLLVGFVLWVIFDGNAHGSFGLRQSVAELLTASMLPIILINLIGFRDAAFSTMVSIGENSEKKIDIPIKSGGLLLYFVGLLGVVSALVCLIVVSGGIDTSKTKMVITFAAAIWGGTTGVVFNKYFKQYALGT